MLDHRGHVLFCNTPVLFYMGVLLSLAQDLGAIASTTFWGHLEPEW